MTKRAGKIDTRNPFIPSHSRLTIAADLLLVLVVLSMTLVAVSARVAQQLIGSSTW
ncbi:hypothetical protein N2599_13930 [Rhizobium sullae]|uniref:Uncharacterized protein n=1 Tax=Rhizobium sullae TaxID=50338 RepID=A0ABY5XFL0_RHISU|nr:hypothetical protein [Rhizobium sullae]UWU13243.1 hypothetical protein N2599_13930 [Rhizobium sullae]